MSPCNNMNWKCSRFTLFEVLLALFITILLFASVNAVLSSAFTTRQKFSAHFKLASRTTKAISLIAEDMEHAVAVYQLNLTGFTGSDEEEMGLPADSIEFNTTTSIFSKASDDVSITNVRYYLAEYKNTEGDFVQDALELRRETMSVYKALENSKQKSTQFEDDPDEELDVGIIRGVTGFNVRYFNGTEWNDEWKSGAGADLPDAIYIELRISPEAIMNPRQYEMVSEQELAFKQYITIKQGTLDDAGEKLPEE